MMSLSLRLMFPPHVPCLSRVREANIRRANAGSNRTWELVIASKLAREIARVARERQAARLPVKREKRFKRKKARNLPKRKRINLPKSRDRNPPIFLTEKEGGKDREIEQSRSVTPGKRMKSASVPALFFARKENKRSNKKGNKM